jgi:uncharacterized protein (TIGR03085 family)
VAHHAVAERREFAQSLLAAGPLAPTLCSPWRAQELAAHIVLRARSPRYGAALNIPRFAATATKLEDALVAQRPYPELVEALAAAPRCTPTRIGGIDDAINLIEFVAHHEDLRRAAAAWEPRILPGDRRAAVWAHLRTMTRTIARSAISGLRLEPADLPPDLAAPIIGSQPTVTVRGDVVELMMTALGRARAARIELDGDAADVQAFREAQHMA